MTYAFTALIVLGITTNAFWLLMKSRVNGKLQGSDRVSEWSRSFPEVARKYHKPFPDSHLPVVATVNFALCLILVVVLVIISVVTK